MVIKGVLPHWSRVVLCETRHEEKTEINIEVTGRRKKTQFFTKICTEQFVGFEAAVNLTVI
jgi:hypothetical protein